MRALHKDDMNGDERFIYTMVWCEIFGYAYPSRYAHILAEKRNSVYLELMYK